MTLEAALSERLLEAPDLVAVAGRVDWLRRPGRALPSVTLHITVDPRPQHFRGFQQVRATQVQVDVWAARASEAAELRDRVVAILTPSAIAAGVRIQRAMVTNITATFEQQEASEGQPQGELYRQSIDFIFTHNA